MLEKEYETKKPNEELIRQYIKDIEYAEKLEVPDKVDAVVAVNDEVGMLSSNEFLEDDDKEDTTEQDPETQDSMDADFAVPDGEAPVPSVENELTDPFAGDVNAEPVAADSSETDGDIVDSGETKDSDSQSVITQIITSVKGIRNNKNKNNGE